MLPSQISIRINGEILDGTHWEERCYKHKARDLDHQERVTGTDKEYSYLQAEYEQTDFRFDLSNGDLESGQASNHQQSKRDLALSRYQVNHKEIPPYG